MQTIHNKRIRLNIQLIVALILAIVGVYLLIAGFWVQPTGEIHDSVLVAFGEILTFSAGLLGVDYTYSYRKYREELMNKLKQEEHGKDTQQNRLE